MVPEPALDKTALDLEWPSLLDRIAGQTVSEAGAALVRRTTPAETLELASARADLTRHALGLFHEGTPVPAAPLPDCTEALDRVARSGVATGKELAGVRRLLAAARTLRSFCDAHAGAHPSLAGALGTAPSLDGLTDEIDAAVDETGAVVDGASPELSRARRKVRDARRELTSRLGELLDRYGDVLRDRYYIERDGRFVLPVRSDAPFRVDGIVLGSSASGGTLYVEPREVTDLGNRVQMAEAEVEREVARILGALSLSVKSQVSEVRSAALATALADSLAALARWGASVDGVALPIDGWRTLDLRTMRHPLLAEQGESIVPNDIRLEEGRGLILSGPNAGGKTVALKCLGLAAWMVRAGIPVPADPTSTVGFFEPVLTDIGDEQSLSRSLSTFSAHAARLGSYVSSARPGALVLLDEVASGTDPDEGAALATAVLESLVSSGAAVAVTTHYERLKQLAPRDARFENASVGFDFESMSPTFRLTLGIPGASSALAVALRYGIPEEVVARARDLLPEETLRREALLAEIETDRARAESDRRAAEAERREQEKLRDDLHTEVRRAREQERARLAREGQDLTSAVREARVRVREAMDRLKKGDAGRETLREVERAVSASAAEIAVGGAVETALRPDLGSLAKVDAARLAPGTMVFVPRLQANAEVLEAPSRGRVRVAAGALKLTLGLHEITARSNSAHAPSAGKRKQRVKAAPARIDRTPVRTDSVTCDVRGLRVDEAIDRVEAFLDRLLSQGDEAGFVLHGHGTGALKSAIREHLGTHRRVERRGPADEDQGGDAFTVLWVAG